MEVTDSSGRVFHTGCLPRVSAVGERFPVAGGDDCPVIDRSEWGDMQGLEAYEYADENQASNNSCCLTSLANALEFHFAVNGREKIRLDWLKIWRRLARGRNVGVALDSALSEVTTNGFPVLDRNDVVVLKEYWDAANVDQFLSGIYSGCRGIYGRFIGRGGHAEFCAYVRRVNSKHTPRIRGSWGRSYGDKGWYDVPLVDLEKGIPYFGGILIREVELRKGEYHGWEDAT